MEGAAGLLDASVFCEVWVGSDGVVQVVGLSAAHGTVLVVEVVAVGLS